MSSEMFIEFLKKHRANAGRALIVIAEKASHHTSGKVKRFLDRRPAQDIILRHLGAYAPELNPDKQVRNHPKPRLGKLSIEKKATIKRSLLHMLRSIQKHDELVRSFLQLDSTRDAAMWMRSFPNNEWWFTSAVV